MGVKVKMIYSEEQLKAIISKNLKGAIELLGMSQKQFAEEMHISESSLSGYISGKLLPPLELIINLCMQPALKKGGVTLQMFMLEQLSFEKYKGCSLESFYDISSSHKDYEGNYLLYYYDNLNKEYKSNLQSKRRLKYGVLSIYEKTNLGGNNEYFVYARLYRNIDKALNLKRKLDELDYIENIIEKEDAIYELISYDCYFYSGIINFRDDAAFISMKSSNLGDQALIILHVPKRKKNKKYLGGLGCIASKARCHQNLPVVQKIILSRNDIVDYHSEEEIGNYLLMLPSNNNINMQEEANLLIDLFESLYSKGVEDGSMKYITERDKRILITSRLEQLITNKIKENYWCLSSVTVEDDANIYRLLKEYDIED